MRIEHPEAECESETRPGRTKSAVSVNPRIVLEELFNLLEDYSPTWYTEAHRSRALAAMFSARPSVSERFSRTYSPQYNLPEDK